MGIVRINFYNFFLLSFGSFIGMGKFGFCWENLVSRLEANWQENLFFLKNISENYKFY